MFEQSRTLVKKSSVRRCFCLVSDTIVRTRTNGFLTAYD